jgi:hypothetical protein
MATNLEVNKMLIPKMFYGSYKEVKMQTQKMIKKIIRSGNENDIRNLLSTLVMADTNDNSDLIITHRGIMPNDSKIYCFMIFVLSQEVMRAGYSADLPEKFRPSPYKKPLSVEKEEILFFEITQQPWGLISVISEGGILLGYPFTEELQRQWKETYCKYFLHQLLVNWDVIQSIGDRYIDVTNPWSGLSEQGYLTSSRTILAGLFCNLGLEENEVKHLLAQQNLPQLIHEARKVADLI